MLSRRAFVERCGFAIGLVFIPAVAQAKPATHTWRHVSLTGPHPTPRPGITGAKVLTKAQLTHAPKLAPLFDSVREIPEIIDGIHCNCGCATMKGFYSLLSCYEGDGMAQHCPVCQGQGKLAVRLKKEGKSLDEIRVAIDAQFGDD